MTPTDFMITARDGTELAATLYPASAPSGRFVIMNSAMATPRGFYRYFASALAEAGYSVITWDYRGIRDSAPDNMRGYPAKMRDWGLIDIPSVVDWVVKEHKPEKLFMVGHSAGGQVAGLMDNPDCIDGMVTLSAQSAYWKLQGGWQKLSLLLHVWLTVPVLATAFGYLPWSWFGGTDVPGKIALEWARWSRNPGYLRGDSSLPLERYEQFTAPVLAYSIEDDHWGTARAVDSMMSAYPNLDRRHLDRHDHGLQAIGHMGYFRKDNARLWREAIDWLGQV